MGVGINQSKFDAISKAKKSAISDGIKRCCRYFGKRFGLKLNSSSPSSPSPSSLQSENQRCQRQQQPSPSPCIKENYTSIKENYTNIKENYTPSRQQPSPSIKENYTPNFNREQNYTPFNSK